MTLAPTGRNPRPTIPPLPRDLTACDVALAKTCAALSKARSSPLGGPSVPVLEGRREVLFDHRAVLVRREVRALERLWALT